MFAVARIFAVLLFLVSTLPPTPLVAQRTDPGRFTTVGARLLLLDYELANAELRGLQVGYGMELHARHQLNQRLALEVPLRAANADVGGFTNPRLWAVDLLVRYTPLGTERALVPFVSAGAGLATDTQAGRHRQYPLGLGADVRLGDNVWFAVRADYRPASVAGRDHMSVGLGYTYRLAGRDTDGDRIPDGKDRCPRTPGSNTAAGCPDRDRDGVPDDADRCPEQAGPAGTDGCPDYDGDGVPDARDQCPYEAGKKRLRGCPDLDDDGVPDDLDACPNVAGSLLTGCPDADGDGFEDHEDECPRTAGTNRGCPELPPGTAARLERWANRVSFSGRASVLDPTSYPALDELATLLRANPAFRLTVAGHTSAAAGTPDNNQRLSELRALACRSYLTAAGVSAERVKIIGYGGTRPRADEGTATGRALNERVVFYLVVRE